MIFGVQVIRRFMRLEQLLFAKTQDPTGFLKIFSVETIGFFSVVVVPILE